MPLHEHEIDDQTEIALFDRATVPDGRRADVMAMNIRQPSVHLSSEFVENIRRLGVLEPILLREPSVTRGAPFQIIDGHRRVAAMNIIDPMRPIPALIYNASTPVRQIAAMSLSANMHRSPNAIQELNAIRELLETGATIPQIASSLGIPEATIIARLRLGQLNGNLGRLLMEGRMSASLAQRVAAETVQTQQRIWDDFQATHLSVDGDARLTARIAYPERPQDEQIRLLPVDARSTTDIFTALTDEQRVEIFAVLLRTMQPENVEALMAEIPTQTRREIYRSVFSSTGANDEWRQLAESALHRSVIVNVAATYINQNGIVVFLALLPRETRQRVDAYIAAATQERVNTLTAELGAARMEVNNLQLEVARQRDRYRALERTATVGARITAEAGRMEGMNIPAETGRAYRETLQGPSDDPSENASRITPVENAEASSAAQFDYPVVEESWEIVVDKLTEAADAMPLTPSDDCDRFHQDIEGLRVRAIQMERAENANAGVTVGRVIPPPEPSQANSGNVRRPRGAQADALRVPSTLAEHAALLADQAEQINANTRRRSGMTTGAIPVRPRPPRTDGLVVDEVGRLRAENATERRQRLERELGTSVRTQQDVIARTRQSGAARSNSDDAMRRAILDGDTVVQINADGTSTRIERDSAEPPARTRATRPPRRPNI